MNVTLPNGRIIKNVPEGTPKEVIKQKAISGGLAVDSDFPDVAALNAAAADMPKLGVSINIPGGPVESPSIPQEGQYQPPSDLQMMARDTSPMQAGLIGAGRTSDRLVSGVEDIGLLGKAFMGDEDAKARRALLKAEQAEKNRLYAPLSEEHPVATGFGEAVPYAVSPMKIPGVPQAASNVIIPGLMGFSEYGTPTERFERGGLAAGAGFLGSAITRGIGGRPTPEGMDPYIADTINKGRKLGFKVRPSIVRGSRKLQQKEAMMRSSPRTAEIVGDINEHNTRNITRIAARSIGLDDVDRLTPQQMGTAKSAISQQFKDLGGDQVVEIDDQLYSELTNIARKYREGAGRRSKKVDNVVDDLLEYGNALSADDYLMQTSAIRTDAAGAMSKSPGRANALYEIREALDKAFDRSSGNRAALMDARNKWRALMTLEDAVTESGDISYLKLANKIKRTDKGGYVYGRNENELYDALRFMRVFPEQFGRPGTAEALGGIQKSVAQEVKENTIAGAALGGMAGGTEGAFMGGGIGAAYGLLSPAKQKAAASLYWSPALNRGLLPMNEKTQGLLSQQLTRALLPGMLSLPQSE
jgi:hypothetical protein